MRLLPVFSCLAVCCRWVEEARLVLSCLPSGFVVWEVWPSLPLPLIKKAKTMLNQHYCEIPCSLSARLLVTNWALKQRGTLKGRRQAGWSDSMPTLDMIWGPGRTCWRQAAALRPPPQAKVPLVLQHYSEGLSSPTRALRGLQSSTGHQSCQGHRSIMSRAGRNKCRTTQIKAQTGTRLSTLTQLQSHFRSRMSLWEIRKWLWVDKPIV